MGDGIDMTMHISTNVVKCVCVHKYGKYVGKANYHLDFLESVEEELPGFFAASGLDVLDV